MNKFEVSWSTGKKTVYESEESEDKFREAMFGHPTRLPDGVVFTVVPTEKTKEVSNAAQAGEVQKGNLREHQDGDEGRKAAGSGGGDRPVEGGEKPSAKIASKKVGK